MIGPNNSIFDSPSFIQKILRKKSSSKYNIKPLYTSDVVTEIDPWRKQFNAATKMANTYSFNLSPKRKTKTYNIGLHVSPSISSITNNSSIVSDSTILMPVPSISTPLPQHPPTPKPPKRPTSAEVLIKIMDQKLLKKKQLELQRETEQRLLTNQHKYPLMTKSLSATTSATVSKFPHAPIRKNKIIQNTQLRRSSSHAQDIQQVQSNKKSIPKSTYILTQDNDEQDRMVAQHYLLRTAFGSDYNSPIQSQLQKGIVVLDVGCGPGTWTMEMSTAFPKSTFIGIDQTAFYPQDIKPRNCHFRTCVVGQVLPFPDNSIDYIYQRDMNWALEFSSWQPLLLEFQRVLKPGGWIEFVEPDLETQNSLGNELSMNDKLITGLTIRQQDPYAVHRLPTMLAINGFQHVENFSQRFPLGWGSSHSASTSKSNSIVEEDSTISSNSEPSRQEFCSEFARAMSSQYLFLLKSLKPWLSSVMNLSSEKYDEYITGLPAEWKKAKTYINWHCILAQKPHVYN